MFPCLFTDALRVEENPALTHTKQQAMVFTGYGGAVPGKGQTTPRNWPKYRQDEEARSFS